MAASVRVPFLGFPCRLWEPRPPGSSASAFEDSRGLRRLHVIFDQQDGSALEKEESGRSSRVHVVDDLLDHSSFRDSRFGQAFIDAVVGIAQSGVIEPELVQDGRHQIGNTHPIRHGAIAKLIGRAVDISALESSPGE